MKTKKKGIIAAAVIIVAVAVLLTVFSSPVINTAGNLNASKFTSADLANVDNIVLLAHCSEVDGNSNSVAGFKEAVRLGADAVAVDLCFSEDGTPIMTDSYENVGNAPLLEDLFKAMADKKYSKTKLFLNIVQLSDLTKLNKLASDYNVAARTVIIGIDEHHYGLITSADSMIPFYLDYKLSSSDVNKIEKGEFSVPEVIEKYGASGLVIDYSQCSENVIETLDGFGIPVIVSPVANNTQLSKALIAGAQIVWVDNVQRSRGFLDGWIKEMQKRYESSVEQSLKRLSTTHTE